MPMPAPSAAVRPAGSGWVVAAAANYIMRALEHQLQQLRVQTASAAVVVALTGKTLGQVVPVARAW